MIKMEDINLTVVTGTKIYVDIDVFRFTKDEDLPFLEIYMENQGEYELLKEIDEPDHAIVDHDDLRKFALNWIFKNVEITDNFIE